MKAKVKQLKVPKLKEEDMLIVCVGNEERPAGTEDIKGVQIALAQCLKDPDSTLVTHHAIKFLVIKRALLKGAIVCSGIE